jgi:hypothetical protein
MVLLVPIPTANVSHEIPLRSDIVAYVCLRLLKEFSQLKKFQALVRTNSGIVVRTIVFADSLIQARALANAHGTVLGITFANSFTTNEASASVTKSPEQQRIKTIQDQAKRYRELAQRTKAQQSLNKAKQAYSKSNAPIN